jgi:hypothetical protein
MSPPAAAAAAAAEGPCLPAAAPAPAGAPRRPCQAAKQQGLAPAARTARPGPQALRPPACLYKARLARAGPMRQTGHTRGPQRPAGALRASWPARAAASAADAGHSRTSAAGRRDPPSISSCTISMDSRALVRSRRSAVPTPRRRVMFLCGEGEGGGRKGRPPAPRRLGRVAQRARRRGRGRQGRGSWPGPQSAGVGKAAGPGWGGVGGQRARAAGTRRARGHRGGRSRGRRGRARRHPRVPHLAQQVGLCEELLEVLRAGQHLGLELLDGDALLKAQPPVDQPPLVHHREAALACRGGGGRGGGE